MNIASALDGYLLASNIREESTKARKFYLSDMGKCMRIRYLKRKGISSEFDPFVNWTFAMGDLIHSWGYKALESQGLLLEAEDYVETEHFIGRYDGIVKNGKERSVFDFKSAGKYKMKKVMAGEDDEESIAQTLSYVMLLRDAKKDVSKSAFVIYINKEPDDLTPTVFFQKEYILTKGFRERQLREEMDILTELWNKDKIPACSCPAWMKNYNAYQPLCSAKEDKVRKCLEYLESGKKLITTKKVLYLVDGDKRKEVLKI